MKSLKFSILISCLLVTLIFSVIKVVSRVTFHNREEILKNYIEKEKYKNSNEISDKDFLQETGRKMASLMDTNVSPCHDFYEYACGNWDSVMKHSKYENYIIQIMQVYNNLRLKVQKLLMKPIDIKESITKFEQRLRKAQQYYQSCINVDLFSNQKVPEYIDYLNSIGGFPAINEIWKSDKFNWTKMLAHVNIFTDNTIFDTEIIGIYPFTLHLLSKNKFNAPSEIPYKDFRNKISVKYLKNRSLMAYYLKMYGAKANEIDKIINDIMSFGEKLMDFINTMDENYGFFAPIEYFIEQIPEFDWETYFTIYLGHENYDNSLTIYVANPYLFSNLSRIIENTEPHIFANYLSLNFLHSIHFENSHPKYQQEVCVIKIMEDMSFGLGEIYLEEYWDEAIQAEVTDMFNGMKVAFKELIRSANWMTENWLTDALNKVETQIAFMGYVPDPIVKALGKVNDNHFISDNFYANNINGFLIKHEIKIFYYIYNDTTNETHPAKVLNPLIINASYNPRKNSIQIYAADFNAPLYDPRYPKSLKYGAIGQMIGHEMSHAFDNIGTEMDIPPIRWTNDDMDIYFNRSTCFVDQYSKFYYPEVNLTTDGVKTINENIADNGGIKLAYMAYLNYIEKFGLTDSELMVQETVPGVNLNYKQTFFLANAQKYCATYFRRHFLTEIHSIYPSFMLRVNVPLQNFIEFAKVFNCPAGSNMNPIEKCAIF